MTTFLEIEEIPRTMVVDIVRSVTQIYVIFSIAQSFQAVQFLSPIPSRSDP